MEPGSSLAEYYSALTEAAVHHPAGLLAIHYGLWGPDTESDREALVRANRTLAQGCDLGPERRVLDAGCGVGGTAIWLAQEYGVQAVGLTNCEPHVALATEQAAQRGIGHRVEFHYGDFMDLPFPDAGFDVVLNHETFCYAPDKLAFLRGVYRVLKPGGRWQAVEGFLSDKRLSEEEEAIHARMQRGWRTLPLERWRNVLAILEEAGFEAIGERDLDAEVAPAAERLSNLWKLFGTHFTPPNRSWAYNEFMEGVLNYDEGLRQGALHVPSDLRREAGVETRPVTPGFCRAVAPELEVSAVPGFVERPELIDQSTDSRRIASGEPQREEEIVTVLDKPQVVRVLSFESLELQYVQTRPSQQFDVGGLALQAMHGERLAQRNDVSLVFIGRQSVARHPVHCDNHASRFEDSPYLVKKPFPVGIMASALDIDHRIDRIVGKRQLPGTVRVLEADPIRQTGDTSLLDGELQLHSVHVDAGDRATARSRKVDGGSAHSAARVHDLMALIEPGRSHDDLDHSLHRPRESGRICERLSGLGTLSGLEQSEMDMVAVPARSDRCPVYSRRNSVLPRSFSSAADTSRLLVNVAS